VFQLHGLITPDFKLSDVDRVGKMVDNQLYIVGITLVSLNSDGVPRLDFFRMWKDYIRRVQDPTEPKLNGGVIFSIPILIQRPSFTLPSGGMYPSMAGVQLYDFMKVMGLASIPELYWSQLIYMPDPIDHTVGWSFVNDSISVRVNGKVSELGLRGELEKIYKV
jgi:hypothetical protein